jgi:hypothetical protein
MVPTGHCASVVQHVIGRDGVPVWQVSPAGLLKQEQGAEQPVHTVSKTVHVLTQTPFSQIWPEGQVVQTPLTQH